MGKQVTVAQLMQTYERGVEDGRAQAIADVVAEINLEAQRFESEWAKMAITSTDALFASEVLQVITKKIESKFGAGDELYQ